MHNEVTTEPGQETYELDDFLNGTAVVKGKSVGTFYSYKFVGLNPTDGGPIFDDMEERQSELINLGKYDTFTKVLTPSGLREPDVTGSVNNTFRHKQWRLGINLTYSMGAKTRLFRLFDDFTSGYSSEANVSRDLLSRWRRPGDEKHTNIPSVMGSGNSNYYNYSDHWSVASDYSGVTIANNAWEMYDYSTARVVKADYLKIQNISLTYEFDKELISKCHLQRCDITFQTSNLHTFCDKKLKGQTPTQGGFSEVQLSDTPTFSLGLNVEL